MKEKAGVLEYVRVKVMEYERVVDLERVELQPDVGSETSFRLRAEGEKVEAVQSA